MVSLYSVITLPLSSQGAFYMSRYEALMLTVPEITADEAKTVEQQFNRVVADNKGSMISFERWGKYRLAYPVKKNEYGVYFLARFEVTESEPLIGEIKELLMVKLHEIIMRSMVSVLGKEQSLAYQRPQSLEEAPAREVGSFMRENRMDNMHSDSDSDHQEM
jgi:small subunit ribosomal protein S6